MARDLTSLNDSISPSSVYAAVTPNDSTDLPGGVCRSLIVAVGGTLKVTLPNGTAVSTTVPAGVLPIMAARVWSTGTAATGITALY